MSTLITALDDSYIRATKVIADIDTVQLARPTRARGGTCGPRSIT